MCRADLRRVFGEVHAFGEGGVGDAHEHRNASSGHLAGSLDQFAAQAVAEARAFAGRAEADRLERDAIARVERAIDEE